MFTSWAFEMEILIIGWYILVETGSVIMLTAFGSLMFIGTLVAPMFGVFGDRIGHRNLLAGMRLFYACLATGMATLALTGMLNPMLALVLAALLGLVRPSDLGVRGALVATTIPREYLVSAMSVSRTTMDSARFAGALTGAGMFAALGMGPAYVVIVCLYLLSTFLTLQIDAHPKVPVKEGDIVVVRPSAWRDLSEGVAYIWSTPRMQAAMWIAFLVNLTAYPFSGGLLPYIAKTVHQTDQTGLGYLSASFAVGSLAASIALSATSGVKLARLMILSTMGWYVMLLVFVQMESFTAALIFLMLAGVSQSLSMITLAVILLQTANEKFRGRVMGVRMMAIYSLPLGLLAAGPMIERFGFIATASVYSVVGLLFTLLIAIRWRNDLWRALAPANTM
jgi:MFS family permease